MLTALIVKLYKWLVELMLWVFIVAGGIAASRMDMFVDIALNEGWFIDKKVVGFIAGALAAFFVGAIVFGAVLILIEVQKSLRRIETKLERNTVIEEEPTLISPPSPVSSSAERIEQRASVEQAPTLIPPPSRMSAAAEKIEQRAPKPRQKRKYVASDTPLQGSDKSGLDGHHDSGTA